MTPSSSVEKKVALLGLLGSTLVFVRQRLAQLHVVSDIE